MKNTPSQQSKPVRQTNSNTPKPEIRDNLDSRKNEEWETKGDDVTHNKKETKTDHLKKDKK